MITSYFKGYSQKKIVEFVNAKCLLPISIGQIYHENNKLESIIHLINAQFDSCSIVICDSLYKYTRKIDRTYSIEKAYKISIDQGERWLKRNRKIIEKITIPTKVYRWDYWVLQNKNYNKYKESINYLYDTDMEIKKAFDDSVEEFMDRYKKTKKIIDKDEAFALCLEYLKEECSALIAIWKIEKYDYIVYPGKQAEAIRLTCNKFMRNTSSKTIGWLQPMFINNPSTNPKYISNTKLSNDKSIKFLQYFNLKTLFVLLWITASSILLTIFDFFNNIAHFLYTNFIGLFTGIISLVPVT